MLFGRNEPFEPKFKVFLVGEEVVVTEVLLHLLHKLVYREYPQDLNDLSSLTKCLTVLQFHDEGVIVSDDRIRGVHHAPVISWLTPYVLIEPWIYLHQTCYPGTVGLFVDS